ncbi:MAG: two-component system sensor histidine kinase NtrB [Patescibacteria group bacterium]
MTGARKVPFAHQDTQPPEEISAAAVEAGVRHRSSRLLVLGQIAFEVAHQLNNCLTGICGGLYCLESEAADPLLRQELRFLKESAERAINLTQGINEFGRKKTQTSKLIDVNAVISDVIRFFRQIFAESIMLSYTVDGQFTIWADQCQIFEMMLNILINAYDAVRNNQEKNRQISIHVSALRLERGLINSPRSREGNFVKIAISDNGCGISKEDLPKIFDAYFTTKGDFGSGLGLKIVKEIIETHHGWIDAESDPDEGTTFSVFFPAEIR